MPEMSVNVSGFAAPYLSRNGQHRWKISQLRLTHAAITVGLPHFSIAFADHSSIQFALAKALMVSSACAWSGNSLRTPPGYRRLDPSEKGNISYWLGMAMSKIAAHRIVQVGNLQHAAPLKASGLLTVAAGSGRRLADLVGTDHNGAWHVFEAKGRTNMPTDARLLEWKAQAQSVTHVHGLQVLTNSRCLTITGETYSMDIEDPEQRRERRFEVTKESLFELQTAAVRRFVDEGNAVEFVDGRVRSRQAGVDIRTGSSIFIGLAGEGAPAVSISGQAITVAGSEGIALTYMGGEIDHLVEEATEEKQQVEESESTPSDQL